MSRENKLIRVLKVTRPPYFYIPDQVNSQDLLKFLAIITMVIDHLGFYFFPEQLWMRVIGRNSHIFWLFFVGYNYKKDAQIQASIIYAAVFILLISVILKAKILPLNILFAILIYKIALKYYTKYIFIDNQLNSLAYFYLVIICVVLFPLGLVVEYGSLGFFICIFGYNLRNNLGNLYKQSLWLLLIDFLSQGAIFKFNYFDTICRFTVISLSILTIYKFKPVNLNLKGCTKYIVNISSRYSLYLYTFHLVLFIIIKQAFL